MASSSLTRARERVAALRAEAQQARARLEVSGGRAADDLTSLTVDPLGQLLQIEFSPAVTEVTAERWAGSLLSVHARACAAIPAIVPAAPPQTAPHQGPAMPGRPLAPEQAETLARTENLVARAQEFSRRQGELVVVGHAREVWLTFDGAGMLLEARATPAALARGPVALAAATLAAWADGRRRLSEELDLEGNR